MPSRYSVQFPHKVVQFQHVAPYIMFYLLENGDVYESVLGKDTVQLVQAPEQIKGAVHG